MVDFRGPSHIQVPQITQLYSTQNTSVIGHFLIIFNIWSNKVLCPDLCMICFQWGSLTLLPFLTNGWPTSNTCFNLNLLISMPILIITQLFTVGDNYLLKVLVQRVLTYRNLPVNSHDLCSSCPRIITSGCNANIVINATLG